MARTRFLTSLVALLALVVAVPAISSQTEAATTATLEIHKRVCHNGPPKLDIFKECHQYPPEQTVRFKVDNRLLRAVNADGNVTFTGLSSGNHTVTETEGIPLEFVDLRVWCSVLGSGVPAKELTTSGPSFVVNLQAGKHTVCDVYNIPEDLSGGTTARIEIHKRICVNGEPQIDIFKECHQYPPEQEVRFRVDFGASKKVDLDGNVTFTGLSAGNHTVTETEGPPLEFVYLRVWCSVVGSGVLAVELPTSGPRFTVDVKSGEHVICDSYSIPIDLSGMVMPW